jgi:hypothetical protein
MNQKTNEAGKLPDVQLMAGAFLTIVEAGKALCSAAARSWAPF